MTLEFPSSNPINLPVYTTGSSSASLTIKSPLYVIGFAPSTSTESTQAVGGPRPYPSPVCCDRTWSDGRVEKICAAAHCDFTADNLQSVVAHYNKKHDRDTERRFPEVPFKTEAIVPKPRKAQTLEDVVYENGRRLYAAVERHYVELQGDHDRLQEAYDQLIAEHAALQERYDALLAKAASAAALWLET